MIERPGDCPDRDRLHTKCPEDYVAKSEWAEKKMKTHRQKRCPTCNLWAIWVPRRKAKKRKVKKT